MAVKKIIVKDDTLDSLKTLKNTYKISTYDELISELIRASYSSEKIEKISNEELLNDFRIYGKKMLQRIESLHTRVGYFEKDYFLKINDIFDALEAKAQNSKLTHAAVADTSQQLENENIKLKKELDTLRQCLDEIENNNTTLNRKINTLKLKINKKTGIFTTGFEMHLSDEEYQNIFSPDGERFLVKVENL